MTWFGQSSAICGRIELYVAALGRPHTSGYPSGCSTAATNEGQRGGRETIGATPEEVVAALSVLNGEVRPPAGRQLLVPHWPSEPRRDAPCRQVAGVLPLTREVVR